MKNINFLTCLLTSLIIISPIVISQNSEELDKDFLASLPESVAKDIEDEFKNSNKEEKAFTRMSSTLNKSSTLKKWKKFLDEEEKKEDSLTARFGDNIFNTLQSSFMPINEPNFNSSYILDYGDVLNIQLVGSTADQLLVEIKRDGSISIPEIGIIKIAGLSLEEAIKNISANVNKTLLGTKIFISLDKLRDVQVLVNGNAYLPGMYTLSGNTNILHIINVVGGINEMGTYRDIKIIRNGLVIDSIDLYDFLIYGKKTNHTPIRSGDTVFIGPVQKLVRISGGINSPNLFELKDNENLFNLLSHANGFNYDAKKDSIYFQELINGSSTSLKLTLKELDQIIPSSNSHLYIEKFKYITVEIEGEVNRPGIYKVTDTETLSSIISKAGGYTKNAYPYASSLFREAVKEIEEENYKKTYSSLVSYILNTGNATSQSSNQNTALPILLDEYKDIEPLGRIQTEFNLDKIALDNTLDINLRDKDKLLIKPRHNYVHIFGEVLSPGVVSYNSGSKTKDYIKRVGGLSSYANDLSIIVINPDGSSNKYQTSFLLPQDLDIYPGSVIYVPRDIGKVDGLNYASSIATLYSSLALSLASLASISSN
jgi:protein involved in polysaccharide export with SLBB domain